MSEVAAIEPEGPDVEALRHAHARALLRTVYALVPEEQPARDIVEQVFRTFAEDWPCCRAASLDPEVCLYRSALELCRKLPPREVPRARRPGERLMAAIARLEPEVREAVVLHDLPASPLPVAEILGRAEDEVDALLQRGHAQVARALKGEP